MPYQDARPAIAVFWTSTSTSAFAIAMAAEDVGRLVWVIDLSDHRMGQFQRTLARLGSVVDLAGKEPSDVAAELKALDVRGVIAFTDATIPLASTVAGELGVGYHTPAVAQLLNDVVAQRAALAAAGIPTAAIAVAEPGATTADVPLPALVRTGRPDVVATTPAELAAALEGLDRPVLVEQLLTDRATEDDESADLVSVEAMVHGEDVLQVAVAGRFPLAPPYRDTGEFVTSDAPEDELVDVRALAARAVLALGVRGGFVHVDVKRTPSGPHVLQVRGRLGYGVSDMVARAGGGDLVREALLLALDAELDPVMPTTRIAWLLRGTPPVDATQVETLTGLDEVEKLPGVVHARAHRGPGQSLATREGTLAHVYVVEGVAPDHAAAFALRRQILETVRVTYS